MENLIKNQSLIEIHKDLDDFAKHHQKQAVINVICSIEREFIIKPKNDPKDGSRDGVIKDTSYTKAVTDIISALQDSINR